jgi:hypothetical protein
MFGTFGDPFNPVVRGASNPAMVNKIDTTAAALKSLPMLTLS